MTEYFVRIGEFYIARNKINYIRLKDMKNGYFNAYVYFKDNYDTLVLEKLLKDEIIL